MRARARVVKFFLRRQEKYSLPNPSLSANFEARKKYAESAVHGTVVLQRKAEGFESRSSLAARRGRGNFQRKIICDRIPPNV